RLTAYREGKLRKEQEERRLTHEREATARRCRSTERTRFEQRNAEMIRGLTSARAQREDSEIKAQRREQKKRRIKAREEEKKEQTELIDTERKKHGVVVAEKFGKAPGSFAGSLIVTRVPGQWSSPAPDPVHESPSPKSTKSQPCSSYGLDWFADAELWFGEPPKPKPKPA
ncbi:hypothetical protein FOZ62_024469, partial [Perkinsus olseni]